jgi:hypothetical protein
MGASVASGPRSGRTQDVATRARGWFHRAAQCIFTRITLEERCNCWFSMRISTSRQWIKWQRALLTLHLATGNHDDAPAAMGSMVRTECARGSGRSAIQPVLSARQLCIERRRGEKKASLGLGQCEPHVPVRPWAALPRRRVGACPVECCVMESRNRGTADAGTTDEASRKTSTVAACKALARLVLKMRGSCEV